MRGIAICALAMGATLLTACAADRPRNQAVAEYAEPEIVCKQQAPTGSRIKKTVCYEQGGPTGLERDRTFGRLHDLPMDTEDMH